MAWGETRFAMAMTGQEGNIITGGPEALPCGLEKVETVAIEDRCAEMDSCLALWKEEWEKMGLPDISGGDTASETLAKIFNIISDNAGLGVSKKLVARARERAGLPEAVWEGPATAAAAAAAATADVTAAAANSGTGAPGLSKGAPKYCAPS